jgi:hypothetical protein
MRIKLFKILFTGALFVILTAQCFSQTAGQSFDKNQTVLLAKQKAFFEAIKNKQYDFLDRSLAEDYLGVYRAGIIDKRRESKDLRAFPLSDYQMSEIKIVFPNAKTGIVAFRLHVKVALENQAFAEEDNYLECVWTRRGKNWLLSSQSAAKVMNS